MTLLHLFELVPSELIGLISYFRAVSIQVGKVFVFFVNRKLLFSPIGSFSCLTLVVLECFLAAS